MRLRNKVFINFLILTVISVQLYIPFIGAQEQHVLKLDINEISKLALKNNFDIQLFKLDKSISEKELLKAQSVYDTDFDASYKYNADKFKRSSVLVGEEVKTVSQSSTLSKTLPTGTILSLGISHEREASDSAYSTYKSYHESEASVSVTQPFGKNRFGIIDRNDIKITKVDIENSGYTSLDKIEQELAYVQRAYWNLLLATKQVDLTQEVLQSARNLYTTNKKNFEMGMVEPPEFYAVDANLKEKQRDVLFAQDGLNSASNLMRLKLNLDRDIVVVPEDEFNSEEIAGNFEDIVNTALDNRRDYKVAKNDIKAMDLYLEMKKNSLWPQIDLKGTFRRNGLGEKFSESVKEVISEDYPQYTVEVIFSFPLENSSARAEYSQKELEKAKVLVSLKKKECLILVQTHDAFVHVKSLYDSVNLLNEAMELQHKKYLGEEDRFKKGRSDTDRLIRYQNDYLAANLRYLNSLYEYKAAIIDLKVVMNTLLDEVEK